MWDDFPFLCVLSSGFASLRELPSDKNAFHAKHPSASATGRYRDETGGGSGPIRIRISGSQVEKADAPLVLTCPSQSMVSGSALIPLVDNTPLRRMRESAPCACEMF
jgi:hypothetical protein